MESDADADAVADTDALEDAKAEGEYEGLALNDGDTLPESVDEIAPLIDTEFVTLGETLREELVDSVTDVDTFALVESDAELENEGVAVNCPDAVTVALPLAVTEKDELADGLADGEIESELELDVDADGEDVGEDDAL
jgi:hypothetical protein